MSPIPVSGGYDSPCLDPRALALGLARRDAASVLTPNSTQKVTLIVAACYVVAIAILPILKEIIYPFKLLVLTCASVESIQLEPNEGGSTRMRGGIPAGLSIRLDCRLMKSQITLPAGYLGSSFIGAALIACGFDTDASKVACLVLSFFFLLTLWWARKSWIAWITIALMAALIVWDIIDDTLDRKVNTSDASEYANMIGCCGSRFWGESTTSLVVSDDKASEVRRHADVHPPSGAFWLLISVVFFAAGILVGIAAFKDDWSTQASKADNFLGVRHPNQS
ncbi:hypothetical protein JCM24511_00452 [Saitozyma sp. JCM 24511]|nr:hypothetical protein JCM24511_00452 [Saitozyma sp. JCM 24511]